MITPKMFMEFCEKELNVKFIDANTGKSALETLKEQEKQVVKNCDNCEYGHRGDGKLMLVEDMVCVNNESPYLTDFVSSDSICEYWVKRILKPLLESGELKK